MLEDYVIYGLQDMMGNRNYNTKGDTEILNNAITLIRESKYSLERLGCPNCFEKGNLDYLGDMNDYKYYRCKNCDTRIKVEEFYEIVDFQKKINNRRLIA